MIDANAKFYLLIMSPIERENTKICALDYKQEWIFSSTFMWKLETRTRLLLLDYYFFRQCNWNNCAAF